MVLSEAEGFLQMAGADLETARESSDPNRFREGAWGFWLQQAVEKGLKSWLRHLDLLAPRSHDQARLLLLLRNAGSEVGAYEELDRLTDYAVQFHYELDPQSLGLDRDVWNQKVADFREAAAKILAR